MSSVASAPDFVIGIDFGMTCTGVSYSYEPEWPDPKVIQDWTGQSSSQLANKVTTQVSYDSHGRVTNWGFLSDSGNESDRIADFFKLYLDPNFNDQNPGRPSRNEAIRNFVDYMRCAYLHIQDHFENSVASWSTRTVEYRFSIPTTWRSPALTSDLKDWLNTAGFGTLPGHHIEVPQTEAESAAVYVAKQHFKEGDVILVCDAGGGTTDINILKVTNRSWSGTQLRGLTKAEGVCAGSALIDQDVEEIVIEKLRAHEHYRNRADVETVARKMIRAHFETFKKRLGERGTNLPMLSLNIPETVRQKVEIPRAKVCELFDKQISIIFKAIDRQLEDLERNYPAEHVAYMVVSGGLGSSQYLIKKLKARYQTSPPHTRNAQQIQVLIADEPQLAVVKGLVLERIQQIQRGKGVYLDRCCRSSFGVVCREKYNKIKHLGEPVTEDPFDKQKWAEGQIDWLIKEGDIVPNDGILRPYKLKIPIGKERQSWKAQIVTCDEPARNLPTSMLSDRVRKVCTVRSAFSTRDFAQGDRFGMSRTGFRLKNKGVLKFGPQYHLAEFNVAVVVGSTDLKFRLLSKDGARNFSQDHEEVEVKWEPANTAMAPAETMNQMYR